MTREEICNSMTLQDAIQVFRDTNAYGTMDIAKSVIIKALQEHQHYKDLVESYEKTINKLTKAIAEQQPSEDCIRRSDIGLTDLEILMCNGDYKEALKMLLDKIKKLPSVTPQPKAGHWTHDGGYWKNRWICSECGYKLYDEQSKYCPECGAKMQEVQK